MDEPLSRVLDAHGGLEDWTRVTKLRARLSLGGPFWAMRGWPDVYANQTVVVDPHSEHITFMPFTASDRMSIFDINPERIRITTLDGRHVDERTNPRGSFPAFSNDAKWDAIQVAYFTSAAFWNYLTEPFVFARPDVQAKEVGPWQENGETWRRLAVTFPPTIANHNTDQVFYYDDKFMQRRMDYSPDVAGNPWIAHYTHDPKMFDGLVLRHAGSSTSVARSVSQTKSSQPSR